ncbi:MAG: hypothetical protein NT129_02325 [Candidatus Aenigmarchaeota archaeon]|nr:hypothetical protein [Candidatus Aenigmarchaeota archaeon]
MLPEGIDLSQWDPRTIEIIKKYGLEKYRYDSWLKLHEGDLKSVELEYLRHLGEIVYKTSLEYRNNSSIDYDCKKELESTREAKGIFELFEKLDTTPDSGRRYFIKYCRELCDLYLAYAEKE